MLLVQLVEFGLYITWFHCGLYFKVSTNIVIEGHSSKMSRRQREFYRPRNTY